MLEVNWLPTVKELVKLVLLRTCNRIFLDSLLQCEEDLDKVLNDYRTIRYLFL